MTTKTKTTGFTLQYAAPEVLGSDDGDEIKEEDPPFEVASKIDVYGLAIVM